MGQCSETCPIEGLAEGRAPVLLGDTGLAPPAASVEKRGEKHPQAQPALPTAGPVTMAAYLIYCPPDHLRCPQGSTNVAILQHRLHHSDFIQHFA